MYAKIGAQSTGPATVQTCPSTKSASKISLSLRKRSIKFWPIHTTSQFKTISLAVLDLQFLSRTSDLIGKARAMDFKEKLMLQSAKLKR